jgi:hypothetical protein
MSRYDPRRSTFVAAIKAGLTTATVAATAIGWVAFGAADLPTAAASVTQQFTQIERGNQVQLPPANTEPPRRRHRDQRPSDTQGVTPPADNGPSLESLLGQSSRRPFTITRSS